MPNGDRTGPVGAGAMSGRGMGICAGNQGAGWRSGQARGFQRGRRCGGGRGFGRRNAVGFQRESGLREEMEALRMQLVALGQQMAGKKD